ncbi:MAG: TetR/AcrR family transcriptional regulator [Pseudomonadota bacterium]
MLDRQKTILQAATGVFSKYGFKRATMNDIAAEAGVARQTLYNTFNNKEAILKAIIEAYVEDTCVSFKAHLASGHSLEDGLELAFDHFARKPYELIHRTSHGGEIMEAFETAAGEEMAASRQRFSDAMVTLLTPHVDEDAPDTLSVDRLADFVVHTAMGHKAKAASQDHLEQLLSTLKTVILKSINRP